LTKRGVCGQFSECQHMLRRDTLDLTTAASRRRFFIDRVRRRGSRGAGSNLQALMELPGSPRERDHLDMIEEIFQGQPVCFIGAHAVAAYAPERMTKDVDCFTTSSAYELAIRLLLVAGYRKDGDLNFPTTALGLFGSRWIPEHGGRPIDLISTEQVWGFEAFRETAQYTREGDRVTPLAYLVLMKLDAARSIDQGDLSRMLGRLSDAELDTVATVIKKGRPGRTPGRPGLERGGHRLATSCGRSTTATIRQH
jgi:hypothetical protein